MRRPGVAADRRWTAAGLAAWMPLVRDAILWTLGCVVIMFAVLRAEKLGLPLVAAFFTMGGTLLGIPPVIRSWQKGSGE